MTWDKATALAKSIGGNIDDFTPTFTIGSKVFNTIGVSLGVAGALASAPSVIIGMTDGDITNTDWRDAALLIAGVGAIYIGGWVAVGSGTVSVGVAIYDVVTTP